ncbi:MAG: hypothetical protein ACQEQS_10240 [Thermodesulfobacteriota bacterium]
MINTNSKYKKIGAEKSDLSRSHYLTRCFYILTNQYKISMIQR